MRVVLDTTVLISAIRSRNGAAAIVLAMALEGRFILLLDYSLVSEYRDVALRSEHVNSSHFSFEQIISVIELLQDVAEPVEIVTRYRPLSTDPDDDHVLELAINGQADVIVTTNLRHLKNPAEAFGILAVDAKALLITMKTGVKNADSR